MSGPRDFEDIGQFISHLAVVEGMVKHRMAQGLEKALVLIETDAKEQIGHYQPEVGPYSAWAPLTPGTEAEKAREGAPAGAPLLRHGALYASFQHEVISPEEGIVGSTDPTMVFHEMGTDKMPPRPVMGPALYKNRERIQQILGRAIVEGIIGGELNSVDVAAHFGGHIEP